MSNASLRVKQLIQDMIGDRKYYVELNELLEKQRLLIIARQTAELDALNAQLIEIYQYLSRSAQQRHTLLQQLGVPSGPQGIKALFAKLPASHHSKVNALWEDLERQANRCHSANESNGILLNMQQEILMNLINTSEPENWLYQQV
ncbi:flagellar protein FlgN [Enterobacteriaceae bacterium H20N1]|uniref:Flagellar protein FlgN n=1 Tax=Dryocola boscaweniae TaxID=2925397 RepID=A0A9X2W6P4_9ENTR|nr:flagellar protein FlgN [Dryocola boscaweniae]MCT4701567.1 flagellar protein FlgN [Dryocola boscaweniae]MCT4716209.1 flagellar protein FlgN [Dryocola boscaweniae]MCT4718736.1 flagellar protein FlgN [Dryocola boscaweniae]